MMGDPEPRASSEPNNEDNDLVVVISDEEEAPHIGVVDSDSESSTSDSDSDSSAITFHNGEIVDSLSGAPVLSAVDDPQVNPNNARLSPPKLQPAVVERKISTDDAPSAVIKTLKGSMKNTPASLSIIDAPSTASGSTVRSTRSSIDPSFAAKQRSFLNKVHIALSSARTGDTSSCESDQDVTQGDELSDDESPEYSPGLEGMQVRRIITSTNGGMKRRREGNIVIRGKTYSVSEEQPSNGNLSQDVTEVDPLPKKRCIVSSPNGKEKVSDIYCWLCHREDPDAACASCPRAYHDACVRRPIRPNSASWVCPECVTVLRAENQETRSKALKMLTLDQLCKLLSFAVERMKSCNGADIFENAVDPNEFPSYPDHIINPMHLSLLEKNIKRKMYGSTEAFLADASWIVHNCIIFNTAHSKLSSIAKTILRICKQEMAEIENCPDCYKNAYSADDNWFILVCQKPHVLVWAKLKGFPYWPAKVIRANADLIDVRFFGAHDRAWVPARDCFLYSEDNPNPNAASKQQPPNPQQRRRNPRNNLEACIEEVELHIKLLQEKFSEFTYAPMKTTVNPKKLNDHLLLLLPKYDPRNPVEALSPPESPISRSLLKRNTEVLQMSVPPCPLSKRMKNDSSSPLLQNIHYSLSSAKENDNPSSSKNGVTEKHDNRSEVKEHHMLSVSKTQDGNNLLSQKSAQTFDISHIKKTPSTSPESTSLAEQLLKRKDVRKIGLVDRIQKKISLWASQSHGDSNSNLSDEMKDEDSHEDKVEKVEQNTKNDEENTLNEELVSGICEDTMKNSDQGDIPGKCENVATKTEECKRDLFASARSIQGETKESVNKLLECYNISKTQPKVVLKKLIIKPNTLQFGKIKDIKKDSESTVKIKAEHPFKLKNPAISSSFKTTVVGMVEKVTVSKMEVISDSDDESSSDTDAHCTSSELPVDEQSISCADDAVEKSIVEPTVTVTKETCNPTAELTVNPTDDIAAEPASESVTQSGSELAVNPTTVLENELSVEPAISKASDSVTISVTTEDVNDISQKGNSCIEKSSSISSVLPQWKIVSKPFTIRAKSISELRDSSDKKKILPSPKPTNIKKPDATDIVESSVSSIVKSSPSIHDVSKDDQLVAVKSILPSSTSVHLESSISSQKDSTTLQANSAERTSSASSTASVGKVKQAKLLIKCVNSPNKLATPKVLTTSPTRIVPGATSILRINNPSVSDASISVVAASGSGQTLKLPATQIMNFGAHSTSSRPLTRYPPPNLTSCLKTPTYVTVSQASTGLPIVRRILPKAIPLSSVTAAAAGGRPVIITAKQPFPSPVSSNLSNTSSVENSVKFTTSRISVSPLVTSVTSSPSTATVSPTNHPGSNHYSELEMQLKSPVPHVVVGSPHSSVVSDIAPTVKVIPTACTREMPSLSMASVFSSKPVSSIEESTVVSSSVSTITTALPHVPASSSSSLVGGPELKGPLSREFQYQANKMTEVFLGCMKDCLNEMGSMGNLEAQICNLQFDMERLQWQHRQEIEALRHNTEILLSEIQDSLKAETQHAVSVALANAEKEKEAAVLAAKNKQWCAFCKNEALFYCCWNTSYCDYRCQQQHWPVHSLVCSQNTSTLSDHGQKTSLENGEKQPASLRRIVVSQKEVVSPPLLKKC